MIGLWILDGLSFCCILVVNTWTIRNLNSNEQWTSFSTSF